MTRDDVNTEMILAESSADLTPQHVRWWLEAVAIGKAQIAAIEAGLPASELGLYDWNVVQYIETLESGVTEERLAVRHRKRLVG